MTAHASEAAVEAGFAEVLAELAVRRKYGAFWDSFAKTRPDAAEFARQEALTAAQEDAAALLASPEFAGMVAAAKAEARHAAVSGLSAALDRIKAEEWRIFVEATGYDPEDPSEDDYGTCVREAIEQVRERAKAEALREAAEDFVIDCDHTCGESCEETRRWLHERAASHGEGTAL